MDFQRNCSSPRGEHHWTWMLSTFENWSQIKTMSYINTTLVGETSNSVNKELKGFWFSLCTPWGKGGKGGTVNSTVSEVLEIIVVQLVWFGNGIRMLFFSLLINQGWMSVFAALSITSLQISPTPNLFNSGICVWNENPPQMQSSQLDYFSQKLHLGSWGKQNTKLVRAW